MKIKITEIECGAEELRQCNTVADGILNILRGVFNPVCCEDESEGVTFFLKRSCKRVYMLV